QESDCQPIGCVEKEDGSTLCGYYQFSQDYYEDCGAPGKRYRDSVETAWKRCANDYNCSTRCVQKFVDRYKLGCPNRGTCEQSARLHNGGINGCNMQSTLKYWDTIKSCCQCS
ncbi:hypothetical protein PMAYCL1PPCAC_21557, partial [Pristionchus mayeri]